VGTIKAVNEVVRERMNKCVDILAKEYMKTVRPIYGSTEHGKPYHIGSCVLIEFNSIPYLITAAHVIDQNEITTLYVSGENNLIQIEAEALITKSSTGNRDDDKLDFSILPLSSCIVEKLGEVIFLNESSFLSTVSTDKGRLYLALGFPNSKNKKVNNSENKVSQNPFVYSSTLNSDRKAFNEVGANESQHYLLDFCSKHSKDENNKKVNSIAPKGASGGGLFFIEGMVNPKSYRPNSECSGKLAGILIENHKKQKVIIATKLSVVINALTSRLS
jgi:hypothetical protein